jgi:glycosyltransferase involved in cell wall biosynthesis
MTNNTDPTSTIEIAEAAEEAVHSSEENAKASPPDRRPSILFCCPGSILEITSGAALSLRTILSALVAKGFRAVALQATIFDSAQGGEHIMKAGESQSDKPIWRSEINGVEHLIVKTGSHTRRFMTCQEEETYINLFRAELAHRRPDMVFLWGGLILERTIMREAKDAGIPVVFYLVNEGYKDKEVFKDVSVIITDTQATAKLYKERHNLDCQAVGKFIDTAEVIPKVPRRPDFITFINPSFEKGVSVFMPLAKLAAKVCPEVKFLVVQSRGRWPDAMQVLKFVPEDFPNVTVIGHQTDMRPVYASTKALLLPSLWHESGARVIAEAQLNGIPVLASNTGGSAELIDIGGKIFDIPEEVRKKRGEVVITEEDLQPWIEEIKRIWNDQEYYNNLSEKVMQIGQKHDISESAQRFIKAVSAAVLKSKGIAVPKMGRSAGAPGTRAATRVQHPAPKARAGKRSARSKTKKK